MNKQLQYKSSSAQRHLLFVGASSGLGLEASLSSAFESDRISIIGRRKLDEIDNYKNISYYPADLTKHKEIERAIRTLTRKWGKIDACVFFQRFRGSSSCWDGEIEVSLTATKHLIEYASKYFNRISGAIVVVSSINAHGINPQLGPEYHISKAGLNHLVRYYAVALGCKGITVNSISAGTFTKKATRAFIEKKKSLMAAYKRYTPLGRLPQSEDIIDGICIFLSPQAKFITGQDLVIDGGLSLRLQDSMLQNS